MRLYRLRELPWGWMWLGLIASLKLVQYASCRFVDCRIW
jgi:hypothetical protein